jgi:hypothetical protein
MGGLELWQTRATQPGQEKRRWREKEPLNSGVRSKGQLCLDEGKKRIRLLNKPGWPA